MEGTDHIERRDHKRYLVVFLMLRTLLVSEAAAMDIRVASKSGNWWDARELCRTEYDGDLYIPESTHIPYNFKHSGYYWLGALETSDWKWTDNSPLCENIGYLTYLGSTDPINLSGNSVSQCYRKCPGKTYFGLSGTRCYCLDHNEVPFPMSTAENVEPCPGNFYDKCGNGVGMSVYRTDIDIHVRTTETGQCVYAQRLRNDRRLEASSCRILRHSICSDTTFRIRDGHRNYRSCTYGCHDGICTTCDRSPWSSARNRCNLVKVTNQNKDNIFNLLTVRRLYWVGLYRDARKIWINGSEIANSYETSYFGNSKCLALWYKDTRLTTPFWTNCSLSGRALCVVNKPATEKAEATKEYTGGNPSTTAVLSEERSTNIDLGRTSQPAQTANKAITTTDEQQDTERIYSGSTIETNYYGLYMYIGTGLGVIVLAVSIAAVIIIMKRKETFCFHKEQTTNVRFQATSENLTNETGPQDRDQVPSFTQANPDNISDLYSKVDKTQRKTAEVYHGQAKEETRPMHSHNGVDDPDVYSRAGQWKSLGVDNNCYNHLNTDGENDYDIAGVTSKPDTDRRDSTYNHLGALQVDKEEIHETEMSEDTDYYNIESTATRK